MSTWLKDTEMREESVRKDFSEVLKSKLPIAKNLVQSGNIQDGIDILLSVEKQARLANDIPTIKSSCLEILNLCFEVKNWTILKEQIVVLCKRRAQKSSAITAVVQHSMTFLSQTPDEATKIDLIVALRLVSDGKIFVEKERAQLTQMLSRIKETNGNIAEACDVLQEVHVETYGSMTPLEKFEFILEQVRLTLAKKDYIRANIVAKKIQRKKLEGEGFEECKLKYYHLLIEYDTHENNTLELCRHWLSILNTPMIEKDESKWKEALENACIFVVLSSYSNHQSDLLYRIQQIKKLENLPAYKKMIELFVTKEIIAYPLPMDSILQQHSIFNHPIRGKQWKQDLHTRVIEHNIRIIEGYYEQIRMPHLANMLGLTTDIAEQHISSLVSDGSIYAKIDRPAGIVSFHRPKRPEEQLTNWSSNISDLLKLVETTCHLINKENMTYKVQTTK